jgi:uncharacterized membrane protein YeaQ/YmgE (transglycosylase-associated protein family)
MRITILMIILGGLVGFIVQHIVKGATGNTYFLILGIPMAIGAQIGRYIDSKTKK